MAERTVAQQQAPAGQQRPSTADIIDRLSRFEGPPEQFLVTLLAVQCHISNSESGAILRALPDGQTEVLAVYPPLPQGATAPVWLSTAVESAASVVNSGGSVLRPLYESDHLYGQSAKRHVIMVPLRGSAGVRGVSCFVQDTGEMAVLAEAVQRLELTTSLLSLYEMRLTLQHRQADLGRLRMAMETLSAVNESDRFAGSGMTLCNEIASRLGAERVSLGFLKGRYVQIKAMSHTEKFSRKMQIVQDLEAAMEECLDQDVEIVHPSLPQSTYVCRAAGELSKRHGPWSIVSLPLRRNGAATGVVTLERTPDKPFQLEEIEALRLTCELVTARLENLHEHDRWFGARAVAGTRKGLAWIVGPKHTWMKVVAALAFGLVLFMVFVKGQYQAQSPFTLETVERQVVSAPFEGIINEVLVEPPQLVKKGQLLARLKTNELRMDLARAEAKRLGYTKQADAAMREALLGKDAQTKLVESQIAQAQAAEVSAQIDSIKHNIDQADIRALIDGQLVAGDLKKLIGGKVKMGDTLFEIAPLATLRAELAIPEDEIADVMDYNLRSVKEGRGGLTGEIVITSRPDQKIPFVIEQISPIAEVVNQQNVFKVRVKLQQQYDWMLPGMEGVGKVDIDQAPYGWLWTRRLVNWVRMKLWI